MTIALVGDRRGHRSHQELDAIIPRLADELGAEMHWVGTDSGFAIEDFDGLWLAPGSPYTDEGAVFSALRTARERGIPFLGSCGGMQYAVLEFVRNVLGRRATHAESDGQGEDNAVAALACSLYGEERLVVPVPGTRFASWCPEPFVGMHFCNYAPTPAAVAALEEAGVVVGATADDAGAEVLEFPGHPFYVASMFQPHIGALAGEPLHPLVRAFVAATLEA